MISPYTKLRISNVLAVGKPFSMRILLLADCFKMAVNGRRLCDYIHRMSWEKIKQLYVDGCRQLDMVEYQGSVLGIEKLCIRRLLSKLMEQRVIRGVNIRCNSRGGIKPPDGIGSTKGIF
jgi:hypothetical protein